MKHAQTGTVIHGTLRPEDLIPAFADELRALRGSLPLQIYRDLRAWEAHVEDLDGDLEGWLMDELFNALDEYAPEGYYFGAHMGDGSDFGYWRAEDEYQD